MGSGWMMEEAMVETQRTGLLRFSYTPVRDEVRRDASVDVDAMQKDANDHHIGMLVWQAVNDGRSYVVEDLGEQNDEAPEGFIRRGKVHTVRVTLRDPGQAEMLEWVHERAISHEALGDGHDASHKFLIALGANGEYGDELEFVHRQGWGWQRVK